MHIFCPHVFTLNLEGRLPFWDLYFAQSGPLIIPWTHHIFFKSQGLRPSSFFFYLKCYFLPPLILSLWQISSCLSRSLLTVTFFLWLFIIPSVTTPTPGRTNWSLIWFPTHFILLSYGMSTDLITWDFHQHVRGAHVLILWSDSGTNFLV